MIRSSLFFTIALVTVIAAPRFAHAAGPKFEFLCGTFVDGNVKDVLPNPKKAKITDAVGCALRITGAPADWEKDAEANLYTTRYVVDPSTGKKTKQDVSSLQASLTRGDDGNLADLEWVIQPDQKNGDEVFFFRPCEDFDIHVVIGGGEGDQLYDKTVHIAQTCPKPKQIVATVKCVATASDGTQSPVPNKHPIRYSDGTSISCTVAPKAKREKIGNLTVSGHIESANGTGGANTSDTRGGDPDPIDEGTWVNFQVNFPYGDWTECMPGTIFLEAQDESGNVVLTKKVSFDQDCPD